MQHIWEGIARWSWTVPPSSSTTLPVEIWETIISLIGHEYLSTAAHIEATRELGRHPAGSPSPSPRRPPEIVQLKHTLIALHHVSNIHRHLAEPFLFRTILFHHPETPKEEDEESLGKAWSWSCSWSRTSASVESPLIPPMAFFQAHPHLLRHVRHLYITRLGTSALVYPNSVLKTHELDDLTTWAPGAGSPALSPMATLKFLPSISITEITLSLGSLDVWSIPCSHNIARLLLDYLQMPHHQAIFSSVESLNLYLGWRETYGPRATSQWMDNNLTSPSPGRLFAVSPNEIAKRDGQWRLLDEALADRGESAGFPRLETVAIELRPTFYHEGDHPFTCRFKGFGRRFSEWIADDVERRLTQTSKAVKQLRVRCYHGWDDH